MSRRAVRARVAAVLRGIVVALALAAGTGAAADSVVEFRRMQATDASAPVPPDDRDDATAWTDTALPAAIGPRGDAPAGPRWYRGAFDRAPDAGAPVPWAVYLPFLYEGGQVWVNGVFVGGVPEGGSALRVRWERPHLVAVPAGLLRAGRNQLAIRAGAAPPRTPQHFPQVAVGPVAELQPRADRRTFWVRTMPQVTVVVCLLVAGFVLFIYAHRRSEVLYGLFGLASALWGVRTLTFVIETMPVQDWHRWRIAYHGATGGFVVVLALCAMRLAGIRRPALERALVAYGLLGPVWLLAAGAGEEAVVNRVWTAGLIPVGLAILGLSGWTLWRRRTVSAAVMPLALAVAVVAGVHDYLVAWNAGALAQLLPRWWVDQRIFLLHYGADLVLIALGGLLTARFIEALASLESVNARLADLNETLESRVARRERHLAENFERMAELQRDRAAAQERQLIMREIHDGLGSRLFTSLLRVERGDMDRAQIADALRDCIADMRLALEVLSPDDDFQAALGNFLFRWQTQMREAQVLPRWSIEVPDEALRLSRQAALQLLRIAQEALTNVLKHAGAKNVRIDLRLRDANLELEVSDDGHGVRPAGKGAGRGLANMRARAGQLGGALEVRSGRGGTRVLLRLPVVLPSDGRPLP